MEKLDIIAIGESLIELSCDTSFKNANAFIKYYGGDTITTAVAASRLGSKVGYITCVGDDNFKDFLVSSWEAEGLDHSQVTFSKEPNGLYLIALLENNKKEIAYYRKKTAATKLNIDNIPEEYIENAKFLYATGITQSLSLSAKEAIKKSFAIAKEKGLTTAYDPNFTSHLMAVDCAKENMNDVISNTDILFLNAKNDAQNLLETQSIENIMKYFWDNGVKIVVIKSTEAKGFYTGYNGDVVFCKYFTDDIVDTTSAGDAFNGGFLSCIEKGYTPFEATKIASVVGGLQSQGIGAIKSIPSKEDVYKNLKDVERK